MANKKLDAVKLRDLVNAEKALNMLISRPMEGKIAHRLGKILRKATPEIRQFRKNALAKLESFGDDAVLREGNEISLNPKHQDYQNNVAALDKYNDSALDGDSIKLEDCISTTITELIAALPKRNLGTAEEPDWQPALVEGAILAKLWWCITE